MFPEFVVEVTVLDTQTGEQLDGLVVVRANNMAAAREAALLTFSWKHAIPKHINGQWKYIHPAFSLLSCGVLGVDEDFQVTGVPS